ncbi:hypothetical protein ykris0001_14180 [Yersinia kristensenii ATCC 33638]|nr:hypothetical protein ykris0001_14180 [Yersinia kristensenii ATCC 33638]
MRKKPEKIIFGSVSQFGNVIDANTFIVFHRLILSPSESVAVNSF